MHNYFFLILFKSKFIEYNFNLYIYGDSHWVKSKLPFFNIDFQDKYIRRKCFINF